MSVLLACWALILQVLIPLVHVPPPQTTVDGIPSWVLTSLCHGFFTADGTPAGSGQPAHKVPIGQQPVCPVCYGLHLAGTFTPPTIVILPMPRATGVVAYRDPGRAERPALHRNPVQARAPPRLA